MSWSLLSIVDLLLLPFQKPPPLFECRSVLGAGCQACGGGMGFCLLDTSPKGKAEHFDMKWMAVEMKGMAG